MIALGNIQDPQLNFKQGDVQVHSIWQGEDLIWPENSGLVFINARWRVIPSFQVYAKVLNSSQTVTLWTSRLYTITNTGCMNFGVFGPMPNDSTQYFVELMRADTNQEIIMPGSTAGYGVCPDNSYLSTNASGGTVFISGEEAWQGHPQLVFDVVSIL
jgi:hypothetical protein